MATGLSHFNAKGSILIASTSKSKSRRGLWSSACYVPKVVAVRQNQSYWASVESDIEAYLKKAIPIRSPESVFGPMHHLTFAAPRTTAPALCVAACELVGGDRSQAMAAASAIHLMHAAAYAHENLPLTDRPSARPTVQHRYNPNIELLTGDGIIPFGMELLAGSMDLAKSNPDKILRVTVEITRATGSQGVVDGQYQKLALDQSGCRDSEIVDYVCRKKEGELHACGAACGAIMGGGAEEEIQKLRNFGLYVGMAQGMLGTEKWAPGMEEKAEKLKAMALKELESFQAGKKTELISSIVEPSLCGVRS